MQAMHTGRPQPDVLHQVHWNDTHLQDSSSPIRVRYHRADGENAPVTTATAQAERKHSTPHWVPANLSGNTARKTGSRITARVELLKGEGCGSWGLPLCDGGTAERFVWERKAGWEGGDTEKMHDHSLDAALGRHRPLPSADWWEPTQSVIIVSRGHYLWFIQWLNSLYKSLKPGSSGLGVCGEPGDQN